MVKITRKAATKASIPLMYIVAAVALLALLVFIAPYISSIFKLAVFEKNPVGTLQYAVPSGYNSLREDWDRDNLVKSSTASVFDYTLKTDITDYACEYSDWYCAPNSCSGTVTSTDQYGCSLYKNSKTLIGSFNTGQSSTYPYTKTVTKAFTGTNIRCESSTATITTCVSGTQTARGRNDDVYVYAETSCGGRTRDQLNCYRGCWAKYNLTKNGTSIYSSGNFEKAQSKTINNGNLMVQLFSSYNYDSSISTCKWVSNYFRFNIPQNAFDFTVTVPKGEVQQGEDINVKIDINNAWKPVEGELEVYFEVPTVLSTPSSETKKKFVSIPLGKSTHTFTIPTGKVTDTLKVKPTLHVLVAGSQFSGVNDVCYNAVDQSSLTNAAACQYVQIGVVNDNMTQITIVPRTIIKEIEKVVDCQKNSDCTIPKGCVGVTSMCATNKTCVYSGSCIFKPGTEEQSLWTKILSLKFFQWLQNLWA